MTLLYLYKKLERHVHPITKKTFRSFPAQFFQRWLPEVSLEKTFCALFLRMILTFRGQNLVEEGNESTATVNLASALPPRRLKPTVRIQTPVSLTSLYRFFWILSEAVLSVVRQ